MSQATHTTAEAALAYCIDQLKNNAKALCWSSREGDTVLHYDTDQGQYVIRYYGPQSDGPESTVPIFEAQALEKIRADIYKDGDAYTLNAKLIKA